MTANKKMCNFAVEMSVSYYETDTGRRLKDFLACVYSRCTMLQDHRLPKEGQVGKRALALSQVAYLAANEMKCSPLSTVIC